jgi:microcystin-dependent protein
MAPHNHPIKADTTGFANQQSPGGAIWSQQGDLTNPVNCFSSGTKNATMSQTMVAMAGNQQPLQIQNPILGLNFIIATQGVFPSRN